MFIYYMLALLSLLPCASVIADRSTSPETTELTNGKIYTKFKYLGDGIMDSAW